MAYTSTLEGYFTRLRALNIELSEARDSVADGETYGWAHNAERDMTRGRLEHLEDDARGIISHLETYLGIK